MEKKAIDNLAAHISRIFHPFVFAVPAGLLLLHLTEISLIESFKWVLISAALTILPTAVFMRLHPKYDLRDINSRDNRNLLYLLTLTELSLLAIVCNLLNAPETIMVYLYSAIVLVIVGAIINRFTKISLHVGFLSSFSTAISFLSVQLGILFYALTLITTWSRFRMGRHTLRQLILGIFVPVFCIVPVFFLFL